VKTYSTKSNAIRAAKAANVDPATVYATEGGFTFPTAAPAGATSIHTAHAFEPAQPGPSPSATTEPVPYAFAEATNSAGQPAGGPATDSGTPLSDLVDEPPVKLRAKPAGKAAKAARGKGKDALTAGLLKERAKRGAKPAKAPRKPKAEKKPAEPKAPRDTKLSRYVAMLRRPEGCTLTQAMEAFGWQRHTARGAIAGAIKVKLGLAVEAEKVDGEMVYRIVG